MRFLGFHSASCPDLGGTTRDKAPPDTTLPPTALPSRRADTLGLPCWVSMERMMKCGMGICGSCHFGDRLVCSDGPVFEGREMLHLEE